MFLMKSHCTCCQHECTKFTANDIIFQQNMICWLADSGSTSTMGFRAPCVWCRGSRRRVCRLWRVRHTPSSSTSLTLMSRRHRQVSAPGAHRRQPVYTSVAGWLQRRTMRFRTFRDLRCWNRTHPLLTVVHSRQDEGDVYSNILPWGVPTGKSPDI